MCHASLAARSDGRTPVPLARENTILGHEPPAFEGSARSDVTGERKEDTSSATCMPSLWQLAHSKQDVCEQFTVTIMFSSRRETSLRRKAILLGRPDPRR